MMPCLIHVSIKVLASSCAKMTCCSLACKNSWKLHHGPLPRKISRLEAENPLVEKENHLPSTSILGFHVSFLRGNGKNFLEEC